MNNTFLHKFSRMVHSLMGRALIDTHQTLNAWIFSLILLGTRFYIAIPFFDAGRVRLSTWENQEYLFQCLTPVPLLPPAIADLFNVTPLPYLNPLVAAYVTVIGELVLPILVILGLFGRLSSLGLAIMAAVIFFFVGAPEFVGTNTACDFEDENFIANFNEQVPWMIMGVMIFFTGPGRLSLDALYQKYQKKYT